MARYTRDQAIRPSNDGPGAPSASAAWTRSYRPSGGPPLSDAPIPIGGGPIVKPAPSPAPNGGSGGQQGGTVQSAPNGASK